MLPILFSNFRLGFLCFGALLFTYAYPYMPVISLQLNLKGKIVKFPSFYASI